MNPTTRHYCDQCKSETFCTMGETLCYCDTCMMPKDGEHQMREGV